MHAYFTWQQYIVHQFCPYLKRRSLRAIGARGQRRFSLAAQPLPQGSGRSRRSRSSGGPPLFAALPLGSGRLHCCWLCSLWLCSRWLLMLDPGLLRQNNNIYYLDVS